MVSVPGAWCLRDRVGFLQVSWMGLGAVRGPGGRRAGAVRDPGERKAGRRAVRGPGGRRQGIVCRMFAHAHRRAESLRHKKIASRCACQRLSP